MRISHLPPLLTSTFSRLASWLHKRSALRLPQLLLGVLFASGRRTVTSWFRAPLSPTTSALPTPPSAPSAATSRTWRL